MGYRSDISQNHTYTKTQKVKIINFFYKSSNRKMDPKKRTQNITTKTIAAEVSKVNNNLFKSVRV